MLREADSWLTAAAGLLETHSWVLWSLLALSFVTLVLSALLIPAFIVRLPPDYYRAARAEPRRHSHPILQVGLGVLRNLLGAFLLLAGIAMLVLPGQGLLTVLAGLALLQFPGKRGLERRVLRAPGVRRLVDWLRARAGKPALEL